MLFKGCSTSNEDKNKLNFDIIDVERQTLEYADNSKRFYEVSRDFSKQYAHIYSARLNTFRNILSPLASKKWSKKCKLVKTHFVHETDTVVLEDELQRIKLSGDCINVNEVVTGVVVAVLGSEDEDGVFSVIDVCWPGCMLQKPLPKLENDSYLVLMSGLNLALQSTEHLFALNLFLEWISGFCGTSNYQEEISKVVRVIIAGGIFSSHSDERTLNESDVIAAAPHVDSICAALSSVTPLDLMPGCKDPTGIMLPQKPFHYCLFPKAVEYNTFNRVSNPYECDIGGLTCLGTAGEPIKDIMRYSKLEDCLEIMKKTLLWRHIAPTCPDTVPCAPCLDTDPFTMYNCPAIYFSGNGKEFATDLFIGAEGQKVRLVSVPDFCETRTVALVNLKNLECYSMVFT
ncbi:unnamed protein product [Leptidea sinapis]|uniref:DNA polymerase alpha/delta/epsilon subunit B domain-containing protein n=2 Tax=Leptidea sinapis TaxID=189913 RepID=A0A5E4Q014_9NEOP|nr:unnamed protein product [Leptidea sinapis]